MHSAFCSSGVGLLSVCFILFFFAFESFNLMDLGGWVVVHGEYVVVGDVIIEGCGDSLNVHARHD